MFFRSFITLLLSCSSVFCFSQDSLAWKKTYGNQYNDIIGRNISTKDKGYLLYGCVKRNVPAYYNTFDWGIYKLDSCGNKEWEKVFYSITAGNELYCARQTLDKGYLLAGASVSNSTDFPENHGLLDPWVFKLDAAGNVQWKRNVAGSPGTDYFYSIYTLPDSSYLIGGTYDNRRDLANPQNNKAYGRLTKLDKNGNTLWDNIIDINIIGQIWSIAVSPDNKIIVGGHTNKLITTASDNSKAKIAKYSADGALEWSKTIDGQGEENIHAVFTDQAGNIYAAGSTSSTTGEFSAAHGGIGNDIMLFKYDRLGNKLWGKLLGGTKDDVAEDAAFLNDSTIILTGSSASSDGDFSVNNGSLDGFLIKTDTEGNIEHNLNFGGTGGERTMSLAVNADKSCTVAGYVGVGSFFTINNNFVSDLFIVKFKNIPSILKDSIICSPVVFNNIPIIKDTAILLSPKDDCGNTLSHTLYNFHYKAVTVSTLPDTLVSVGTQLILLTQSNAPVIWQYNPDLSCTHCSSPVVQPFHGTTTYIVRASNDYCTSSDTITVRLKESTGGFYIPSAFSPDGNGLNDIFRAIGNSKTFGMRVFNRWGNLIFSSHDISKGWDGRYKGKLMLPEAYTYFITYTLENDPVTHVQKGTVLLL